MKEQAAYSLLTLAGKKATKADVKALLTASGCKADDEALDKFFALLYIGFASARMRRTTKNCRFEQRIPTR